MTTDNGKSIDPLIDRLLKPNEDLGFKVDRLHADMVEVKTLMKSLVDGNLLERIARLETKVMVLTAAAGVLATGFAGVLIQIFLDGDP